MQQIAAESAQQSDHNKCLQQEEVNPSAPQCLFLLKVSRFESLKM